MLQCSNQRGITEMTDVFANKYTYIFKGWIGKGNFDTQKKVECCHVFNKTKLALPGQGKRQWQFTI